MFQMRAKFLLLLIIFYNQSYALPEDKNEIIQVSANSADLSNTKHKGIYRGNVVFDQGTTHLRAAEAITLGDDKNALVEAQAKGNSVDQAHYWTLTNPDKPELHAYADTIRYFPSRHLVELIGRAKVIQGQNSFAAPFIQFDTKEQHIITKNNGSERTLIIYHPEKSHEKTSSS
jgi:lipopolysaccharide export system protein LptA